MPKRTDPHRPGAIIPAHYEQWLDYSLPCMMDGHPMPSWRVDCTTPFVKIDDQGKLETITPTCPDSGRCCVASAERRTRAEGRAVFGYAGKCGVCGAVFVHGTIFHYDPELGGDLVHMGHDCAAKYEVMADHSAYELERGRKQAALAKVITRERNAEERQAFLNANPGLEADLQVDHPIITDIADKFSTYRSLTEKQVALVQKLAEEVRNPKPVVTEVHVKAPTGKGITFEGEIVTTKCVESQYGLTTKMLVKVTTDAGIWLAWGTMPSSLLGSAIAGELRGRRVSVKATLESGRDEHFVFMKRPRAELV